MMKALVLSAVALAIFVCTPGPVLFKTALDEAANKIPKLYIEGREIVTDRSEVIWKEPMIGVFWRSKSPPPNGAEPVMSHRDAQVASRAMIRKAYGTHDL